MTFFYFFLQSGAGPVVPSVGSGNGRGRGGSVPAVADEDAELQAALQASMHGVATTTTAGPSKLGASGKSPARAAEPVLEPEPPAQPAGPSAEEVAAEAASRLPEEPSGPDGCRIGKHIHKKRTVLKIIKLI